MPDFEWQSGQMHGPAAHDDRDDLLAGRKVLVDLLEEHVHQLD